MVFESLVVDLMNRFLGDFIENLDKSQLQIGIWGGDVVLRNLFIKESALDNLELPVKVIHGVLGELTLKIPWKNLYTAPVVADLDGLYLVTVPKSTIKYNEEKEKKTEQDAKQKELTRIDEAKKYEAEKDKPKGPQQDTFAEKMASQVIKNLQVTVKNIHVRYEDHFTNKHRPFSIGATLKGLSFQTTNESWEPMIIKETVDQIFKLIKLDGLALYWNSCTTNYIKMDREELLEKLKANISMASSQTEYQYLLEPIISEVQLRLHTKPENDKFTIPKMMLNVDFEEIAFVLQRNQYLGIMELLESFERLATSAKFRKYRPSVDSKMKYGKAWWRFAYNCVLVEIVQRRRNMFSWKVISQHLKRVKLYKTAYKMKLTSKKLSNEVQETLDRCEEDLDVFNITLARQSAEMEVKKEGAQKQKVKGTGGWLSGWWGGKKAKPTEPELAGTASDVVGEQFDELMTPDEKVKLYDAIGYQENTADPTLPLDFVATKLKFELHKLSVTFKEPQSSPAKACKHVMKLELQDVSADIAQRPAAEGLRVDAQISSLQLLGKPNRAHVPVLMEAQTTEEKEDSLLSLCLEINPQTDECDRRIRLNTHSYNIIYDAATINQLAEFFKPPESVQLKQLQASAMTRFEMIKEQTQSGIQHAIDQHKYTDVTVDFQPLTLLVPEKGVYKVGKKMIVIVLGQLQVVSEKPAQEDSGNKQSMAHILQHAYDKFKICLSSVQILYASGEENWRTAAQLPFSPLHLLCPITLNVELEKSIIMDPFVPKIRISGGLERLAVMASDAQIKDVINLLRSIPLPEPVEPLIDPDGEFQGIDDIGAIGVPMSTDKIMEKIRSSNVGFIDEDGDEFFDAREVQPKSKSKTDSSVGKLSLSTTNVRNLELKFVIKEIVLQLSERYSASLEVPIVKAVVHSLGTEVTIRSYDTSVSAFLGGIYIQHCQYKVAPHILPWLSKGKALEDGPLINIVNTPGGDDNTKLLIVDYVMANRNGPDFKTLHESTHQRIKVHFTTLEVLLHQEALLSIKNCIMNLLPDELDQPIRLNTPIILPKFSSARLSSKDLSIDRPPKFKPVPRKSLVDIVNVAVEVTIDVINIGICTVKDFLTNVCIEGVDSTVTVTPATVNVTASLKDLCVIDAAKTTLYPKIISIKGKEVFNLDIMVYKGLTSGDNYSNMDLVDTLIKFETGCLQIVYVHKFLIDILIFLNEFQAALSKVREASSLAAGRASLAALEYADKSPRVKLIVHVKAPIIILPQRSTSPNALIADLGEIELTNMFSIVKGLSSTRLIAVLDTMNIHLQSVQISRAVMENMVVKAEVLLIKPITVYMTIIRNLSTLWYRGHPNVEILGKIDAIELGISQEDFTMIMNLAYESFVEESSLTPSASYLERRASRRGSRQSLMESSSRLAMKKSLCVIEETLHDTVNFQLFVNVRTINLTLYTGKSNLESGLSVRQNEKSLALFDLQMISTNVTINSDMSLLVRVILHNIVLEDTRPGMSESITRGMVIRMIERTAISQDQNMIAVDFTMDRFRNMGVKVDVNRLYVCMCPEYLLTVANFFILGLPPLPPPRPQSSKPQLQLQVPLESGDQDSQMPFSESGDQDSQMPFSESGDQDSQMPFSDHSNTSSISGRVSPEPPQGEIVINVTVQKPEIILVENSMKSDTDSLILTTHITFMMRFSKDQQTMFGNIKGLSLTYCAFAEEMRDKTKQVLLLPTDIVLNTSAPEGKNMHANIEVSEININICPATIRCITSTVSSLAIKSPESNVSTSAPIPNNLWLVNKVQESDFWFLKIAMPGHHQAVEDRKSLQLMEAQVINPRGQQLIVTVGKIIVKLEGSVGNRTVPLLITEITFMAEVCDWSSKLALTSQLSLEIAYYNERLDVWEPLLEPVEDEKTKGHRTWELSVVVAQNDLFALEDEDLMETPTLPQPKMSITIRSNDVLQTTISKTCLEVLNNLGKAFGDAYNLVEITQTTGEVVAPYIVQNDSGLVITIKVDDTFEMPAKADNHHVGLMPADRLPLFKKNDKALENVKSSIRNTDADTERMLILILEEYGATRELSVVRAEKRAFSINQRSYPGDTWTLVSDLQAKIGCKELILRSILQIHNHINHGVEVYYKMGDDCKCRCGEMTPNGKLNVPLEAVYAAPYELYFKIKHPEYGESKVPLLWRDLKEGTGKSVICCDAKDTSKLPFYFVVKTEIENILFENTGETTATIFSLHLYPCAVFRNLLPMTITYRLQGCTDVIPVEGGATSALVNVRPGLTDITVRIPDYRGKEWTTENTIKESAEALLVWTFVSSEKSLTMDLGLHTTDEKGYQQLSVYCPYWMVNKTARHISYKAGDDFILEHTGDDKDIILFTFIKSKAIFNKKKISLKVNPSDWSDKFSLDTVGSAGTVSCKYQGFNYEVGVKITLSSSGLTKIVIFTPYFMLVNQASFGILCHETVEFARSCEVPPGGCIPFWPVQNIKKMQMRVTIKDYDMETMPFYFTEAQSTLLPVDSEFGGINLEVQVMESAIFIKFQNYSPGMATALIVNYTHNAPISFVQRNIPKETGQKLKPGHMLLYTWQDAIGKRELVWSSGDEKDKMDDLIKDGIGEFFYNSDTKIYWVSFLDGMQRILLFTEDLALATMAQQAGELEQIDQEINVSLKGIGLSLVNNLKEREIAYLAVASSGIVWEVGKKKHFKALKNKQSTLIEEAYQHHQNMLSCGKQPMVRRNIQKLEVDFTTDDMKMFKPIKGKLQRVFQTGLWVQYRTSQHQLQFHAKIQHLQLDNQLPEAIFPTVISPVPPPKSVAADSVPKPFTEVSVMIRKRDFSNVLQFKYCKVLVQELSINVDQSFIHGLIGMFGAEAMTEDQEMELFKVDCKIIDTKLEEDVNVHSSNEQKNYYDILHFSPLKIHLSFSMYSGSEEGKKNLGSNVVNLFIQSVGVVLSDIQDVVFKLGYFERNYKFFNQNQLITEIAHHYSQQAFKQMYVLVLGLDVLGNPFGVIRGLQEGIEDLFYEPYQGAIQGPEEFAEGLALGVRSLFGHAVGGAVGAVSRMTGALGKGIATLTMDDEYQRKRREMLANRPTDLKEGLARGGKGLVMGVVDGVTGIVLRPMEGAKQDGVEGFFKGVGKGLVGALTRPASGVIDFASTTFEGVKRVTEIGSEVAKLRPPRFIQSDGIIRPYKNEEAWGNMTLVGTEKGKFVSTDTYVAHVILTKDMKNVLIVTDKRVILTSKGEVFGHWVSDWTYTWAELRGPPKLTSKGLQFLLKEKQKKSFFSSGTIGKLVPMPDVQSGKAIAARIEDEMAKFK